MLLPILEYTGSLCGPCSYCCWSAKVDVPATDLAVLEEKAANSRCRWLAESHGCDIYGKPYRPPACGQYVCSWVLLQDPHTRHRVRMEDGSLFRWNAHRPDSFQAVLSEPWVRARGVMPLVPDRIALQDAIALIRETRMVPASTPVTVGQWTLSTGRVVRLRLLAEVSDPEESVRSWQRALEDDDDSGLPRAA